MSAVGMILPGLPGRNELRFWIPPNPAGGNPQAHMETQQGQPVPANISLVPLNISPGGRLVGYRAFASGLTPDQAYRLSASYPNGDTSSSTIVRTLPDRISETFTIALATCFSLSEDRNQIGGAYPPDEYRLLENSIRLRFLAGDQLYMDLDTTTGDPLYWSAPDPWEAYHQHWNNTAYAQFLSATPTAYLADDHEYWNDFPHSDIWLAWAGDGLNNPVGREADEAFELYQAALNPAPTEPGSLASAATRFCRSLSFDVPPLSFFVLDDRTARTLYDAVNPGFIRKMGVSEPELDELKAWIKTLAGPGILVISQPLVETPASLLARALHTMGDVNLPDYGQDYVDIWQAVLQSDHNILILTGDIHVSRSTQIDPVSVPGASKKPAFEIVASPLVHIKFGSESAPKGSLNLDVSGHLDRRYSADAVHRSGRADRRIYVTIDFRPTGPRVFCDVKYWSADATGARYLDHDSFWLM